MCGASLAAHPITSGSAKYKKHGLPSGQNAAVFFAEEAIDSWLKQAK